MDELAEKLKMDPVQLRLVNYADKDPGHDRPWTNKHLKDCSQQAADRFGWSKRSATPLTLLEGNSWLDMAWPQLHIRPIAARLRLSCVFYLAEECSSILDRKKWKRSFGHGSEAAWVQQSPQNRKTP